MRDKFVTCFQGYRHGAILTGLAYVRYFVDQVLCWIRYFVDQVLCWGDTMTQVVCVLCHWFEQGTP